MQGTMVWSVVDGQNCFQHIIMRFRVLKRADLSLCGKVDSDAAGFRSDTGFINLDLSSVFQVRF